jgi:hypothetical protein
MAEFSSQPVAVQITDDGEDPFVALANGEVVLVDWGTASGLRRDGIPAESNVWSEAASWAKMSKLQRSRSIIDLLDPEGGA